MRLRETSALILLALFIFAGCAQPHASAATGAAEGAAVSEQASTKELRQPDVIYVPTAPEVVEAMLRVANTGPNDIVYDLGSGDGRIVIAAVRDFGVKRATGIDINPERIREANANAVAANVTDRVRFLNEDLFEADFREATVVTLYLLPSLNLRLLPKMLNELKPGTRIVSNDFNMGSWKPAQTIDVEGRNVHFWTIPAKGTPEYDAAMAAARRKSES
ncbi:MAG TPA: class I SAM-dependent methyltransferase [Thermoanaerobaculia bacterium]